MRFLVFTTLYPNAQMPAHGIFVENRLRAFLQRHDADVRGDDIRVIAPVPWFPFGGKVFGKYARWARTPHRETRHGIEIFHPRYLIPPKIGMHSAPQALARCFRAAIEDVTQDGWDFDFIDAHYFYPDGVAAAAVAKEIGKPLVITARGSDITLLAKHKRPRAQILKAALGADAIITVAASLKNELAALGAPAQKIHVLRNGVDLEAFTPGDREAARAALGVRGPVIVSAGHLIARKGHGLVIDALGQIPNATLLIVGDGAERARLERQAKSAGLGSRVRFLGPVAPEKMPEIYRAADILALASSREGWPNVLLEAMACGAPCVASDVGGVAEVIREPAAGRIVVERTPEAIAREINALLAHPPGAAQTRAYAERHSWDETADAMATIAAELTAKSRAAAATVITPMAPAQGAYRPKLLVTVDTEEQFDWSAFRPDTHRICAAADIDHFQSVCAEAGAKPLYLLTYPLLKNQNTTDYFRTLKDGGSADCGLHLHQWVTPPGANFSGAYFSFQNNLPRDVYRAKLDVLANAYEAAFGARACAHRAGRYGVAAPDYDLLGAAGVRFDFSPSTGFDFTTAGGPDFRRMSNRPFTVDSAGRQVFVTPVSGARALRRSRVFLSQENAAPGFVNAASKPSRRTVPMRLSPEGARLSDLKALTNRLVADKIPVITFTLHSTSLSIGANAYAKDAAAVAKILDTTRRYLAWFRGSIGGDIIALDDIAALYKAPGQNRRA
ncbi:MAG: glycosyltransferase [Alphaproteobacteria bacterium]|nr:glycosyltransferase [Alphaproteobacteria bacterium]